MKNTFTILVGCLILGMGIFIILKNNKGNDQFKTFQQQAEDAKSTQIQTPPEIDSSPSGNETAVNTPTQEKKEEAQSPDRKAQMKAETRNHRYRQAAKDKLTPGYVVKFETIVKELGLDDAQAAHLQTYYDTQLEVISKFYGKDILSSSDMLPSLMVALREDGLSEHMSEVINVEQQEGLLMIQERGNKSKIESRAMTSLSELHTSLELTDEQKDQIYGILYEDLNARQESQSDVAYLKREYGERISGGYSLGGMDLGVLIELQRTFNQEASDSKTVPVKVEEYRDAYINTQVERMATVLDGNQLETYRDQIKRISDRAVRVSRLYVQPRE